MITPFLKKNYFCTILVVLLPLCVSILVTKLLFEADYRFELLLGWAIASVFSFAGLVIKIVSIGRKIKSFFFSMFILNTINLVVFFGVVMAAMNKLLLATEPFILSVFVTYFMLTFYNISRIRSAGSSMIKESGNV